MKKYISSFICGIFCYIGFICYFNYMTIRTFNAYRVYPNRYKLSILFGIISAIITVISLIYSLIKLDKENKLKYIIKHLLIIIFSFSISKFI